MDIESSIRSRIETILLHDARRYAELKQDLGNEEPLWTDPLSQERGLYERIITSCRNAVAEVNGLLEENIEFLSGFCKIVEGIKEKTDTEEICVQIATCALQDFRAEYCGIMLFEDDGCDRDRFCLEAVREDHTILRVHSARSLLGSAPFEAAVTRVVAETCERLDSPDVYRDPRFSSIDWPSVVRSLACVPVVLHGKSVGALVLAHSMPSSFQENHFRVMKILAGIIAHLTLLRSRACANSPVPRLARSDPPEHFSIVLFSFECLDPYGRVSAPDCAVLREVCRVLAGVLEPNEPILPNGETEFITLLPGTDADLVSTKVRVLREAFKAWCAGQKNGVTLRMNLGFSTCRSGENFSRVLEIASAVMHPEADE